VPKAKTGNFTLKKIAVGVPAHLAAHRFASLKRSGAYSELKFVQRGKSAFDIVGYKWPDKGVRRSLGIGKAKNPESVMKYRLLKWDEATATGRAAEFYVACSEGRGVGVYGRDYMVEISVDKVKAICDHLHFWPEDQVRTVFATDLQSWWKTVQKMIARINPSQAGAVTPNQVIFGKGGKSLVGWINRETPTRYEISYKVGSGLAHVWRAKDKVKFMATGRRGRSNPCPKKANPDAALDQALKLSKEFHGFDPRKIHKVKIEWPKALVMLGPCVRLDYHSDKFDGKPRIYFHEFEKPAAVYAAESPQPDGTNLLIIHGHFRIKPEGITG